MAKNVTGASLDGIYGRLNAVEEYHPFEASTFSDWSLEAGDIITVKRGEENYQSPVHSSKMVWRGTPETEINSTGNKEREALAKISKNKYRRSSSGSRNDARIYKEMTSSNGYFHSYIELTESMLRLYFDNGLSGMHSEILQTAEQIRAEIHTAGSSYFSYVDMTATYIVSHVESVASKLGSDILQTANEIRAEVHAANSQVYSYVDQTATHIESHVENVQSKLGSDILQTANEIRSEVHAANSHIYSYVDQTATHIESHVESVQSKLGSDILQTANEIRSEVHAANSNVYSYIDQTATHIETHVENVQSKLGSDILQTASEIRSEVHSANSNIYSYVDQTATYIVSHVESVASSLGSDILQTANQIRTEVHAANSTIYSYIDQTATSIEMSVASTESRVRSSISQTASSIRTEVHSANSAIYSYVNQTASSIRQEIADTETGLQSSIDQQASKIAMVVEGTDSNAHIKAAQIVAAINAAGSNVLIDADKIKLSGDTTVEGTMTVESGNLIVKKYAIFNNGGIIGNGSSLSVPSAADILFGRSSPGSSSISLDGDTLARMIKTFSIDPNTNTLTLVRLDGSSENFSKAAPGGTLISGTWSGNLLTVAQSEQGAESFSTLITTDFIEERESSPHRFFITSYRQDNDAVYPTELPGTRKEYTLGVLSSSKYVVRILNAAGTAFQSATPSYTIPTTVLNVTENGEYTPTGNAVGYSTVTVNVPGNLEFARTSWGFDNTAGKYFVESIDSRDDTPIANSRINYHLGVSGTNVQILNDNNIRISNTQIFPIPLQQLTTNEEGTHTPTSGNVGFSSVTITAPTVGSFALNFQTGTDYSYKPSVTVNGTTYTSSTALSASDAFANGWKGCYNSIEISPTSFSTLNYGQTYTVSAKAYSTNSATSKTTKASVSFTVPADRYDDGYTAGYGAGHSAGQLDGWSAAYAKVVWPSASTSSATMSVQVPASSATASPDYTSRSFTVSVDNSYGYIKYGSTTVARVSHSVYSSGQADGWGQAYNKISWPGSNTSSATMTVTVPASSITANPQTTSKSYTVSVDNSYGYIKNGSTTVARVSHSVYSSGQTNGWSQAVAKLTWPSSNTSTAYMTVYYPASSIGDQGSKRYDVSCDNSYVYIKNGSTTVARATNTAYASGESAGYTTGYTEGQNDGKGQGWNAARNIVKDPLYNTSATMTINFPSSTYNTGTAKNYTVSVDGNYGYIKDSANTIVARVAHSYRYTSTEYNNYGTSRYNTGTTDGFSKCYNSIAVTPGSGYELDYGASVNVIVKVLSSYSSTSYTNLKSLVFTSKADRYWTGFDDGWKHYYDIWDSNYQASGGKYTYPARTPVDHYNSNYSIVWSGVVPGSGGGGQTFSHNAQFYCSSVKTGTTGIKSVTLTIDYAATQSCPFSSGRSYRMYWN